MPDGSGECVVRDRDRRTGLLFGEPGENLADVVRGQLAKGGVADFLGDRLEDVAILGDGVLRAAVESALKPVLDRLPDGVSSGCLDVAGDVLAERPELVADPGLGEAADGAPLTFPIGGVAQGDGGDPACVRLVEVDAVFTVAAAGCCDAKILAVGSGFGPGLRASCLSHGL